MSTTSSKPRADLTDSNTDRVTEPEARAAYIAMKGRRSILGVHKRFTKDGRKTPSERTFKAWSTKNRWGHHAQKHDDKVVAATADKIAKAAVAEAVSRADQFDTLATESLKQALIGLENIDGKELKVSDIRALVEVGERATKMFELLEGRATDRPDDMTRQKLDAVLQEMQDDIDKSLARIPKLKIVQ